MKDLKVRFWHDNKFYYPDSFSQHDKDIVCYANSIEENEATYDGCSAIHSDEVEQRTCEKDIHKKYIYENDIIRVCESYPEFYEEGDSYITKVFRRGTALCIEVRDCGYDWTEISWAQEDQGLSFKVIGNIHQHPELLK